MNYIEALKNDLIKTTTENGDIAFTTTGIYTLDLFSLMGGMRYNYSDLSNLFIRSFFEDNIVTIKILLYLRDILNGLGERNSFRLLFNMLANLNPNLAKQLIPLIPKYGRYDDVLAAFNTPIELDVLKFIETELDKDLESLKRQETTSLLAKWLPSINTSNKEARINARKIARYLNISNEEYRKTLSKLRKGMIIENYLRAKDYTFDYEFVPSLAMLKYNNAFYTNDHNRFANYLNNVDAGKAKINTKTASVTDVTLLSSTNNEDNKERFQDIYWKSLPRFEAKTKAIVVRDGSSSMLYSEGSLVPIDVATSLAIYYSEQLPEPFKHHFITFSERPQLIKIPDVTIKEKINYVKRYNEVANTNIGKVYQLLLDVAMKNNVSQEDMVEQVIIISDMEFDECVLGQSSFETFKAKFNELNLAMPEIVFWNVSARNINFPINANEIGAKLVSGSSQKIYELVINNKLKDVTPYKFMLSALERYKEVDNFIK